MFNCGAADVFIGVSASFKERIHTLRITEVPRDAHGGFTDTGIPIFEQRMTR
jgi:hypothetical protein